MDGKKKSTFSDEEIYEMMSNPVKIYNPKEGISEEDRVKYSSNEYFNFLDYERDEYGINSDESERPISMKRMGAWILIVVAAFVSVSVWLLFYIASHPEIASKLTGGLP